MISATRPIEEEPDRSAQHQRAIAAGTEVERAADARGDGQSRPAFAAAGIDWLHPVGEVAGPRNRLADEAGAAGTEQAARARVPCLTVLAVAGARAGASR